MNFPDELTFVDFGANIGLYSLPAAVGPSGRVIAIEPGAKAGRRLKENIQLNKLGQVCIHACAVGEKEGVTVNFRSLAHALEAAA